MEVSKTKSVVFSLILTLFFFVVIEISVRVYFYATTSNSNYLLYGLVVDDSKHNNYKDGYFKFFPNRNLHHGTTSHSIPTRINNHGFRGQDFSVAKNGLRRVVAMGGSSTFGYYSRDEYTYPSIMQTYLNDSGNTRERYEVINVGVPHMQTKHIVKLLSAEVLPLKPDVITLYSGCNDGWNLYGLHAADSNQGDSGILSMLVSIKEKLTRRSLAFSKADDLYKSSEFSSFRHKRRNTNDGLNKTVSYLYTSTKINETDFHRLSKTVRDQYQANLQQIVKLARENAIELLFVKQKYTLNKLRLRGEDDALPYASASGYFEEVKLADQRLQQQGWLWLEEASILLHAMLMESMEKVAEEHNIMQLDGITPLDENPDYLKSYVHLSEEGNTVLAKIIGNGVLELLAEESSKWQARHHMKNWH